MADGSVKLIENIRQIVRLRQVMRRWKNMSLVNRDTTTSSSSSTSIRRLPSGCLAVYVGVKDRHRFVIPTRFLKLRIFVSLLNQAEEEFGYQCNNGGLVLACDVEFFTQVLKFLDRDEHRFGDLGLEEFLSLISSSSDVGGGFESCKQTAMIRRHKNQCGYTLLLQNPKA